MLKRRKTDGYTYSWVSMLGSGITDYFNFFFPVAIRQGHQLRMRDCGEPVGYFRWEEMKETVFKSFQGSLAVLSIRFMKTRRFASFIHCSIPGSEQSGYSMKIMLDEENK